MFNQDPVWVAVTSFQSTPEMSVDSFCCGRVSVLRTPNLRSSGQDILGAFFEDLDRLGLMFGPLCMGKKAFECVGRESNPGQLLGRQLCSPLYHQRKAVQRQCYSLYPISVTLWRC